MFQIKSVLKFIYEIETNKKLPYLGCKISKTPVTLVTNVFVQETNTGDCIHYNSIAPHRYKTGVIRTLLKRTYKISPDWTSFNKEATRLEQKLPKNDFPMSLIDEELNKFVNTKVEGTTAANLPEPIKLFYISQMSGNYEQDELTLKKIINKELLSTSAAPISLIIPYKNKNLYSILIKNNPFNNLEESHVVYLYACLET